MKFKLNLTGPDARSECLNLIIPCSLPAFPQAPFCLGTPAHKSDVLAGHTLLPSSGSRPVSSLLAPYRCTHLVSCWVRSRVAGHTSCHNGSGVQTPGRIKWTQAQDCSLEIKASECLKITSAAGNWVGKREAISKLHGFSFWRKGSKVGWGFASVYT